MELVIVMAGQIFMIFLGDLLVWIIQHSDMIVDECQSEDSSAYLSKFKCLKLDSYKSFQDM